MPAARARRGRVHPADGGAVSLKAAARTGHTYISEVVFTVLFIGTLQKTMALNVHAHVLGRALWHALAQTET